MARVYGHGSPYDEEAATAVEVETVVDSALDFCEAFDVEPPPSR